MTSNTPGETVDPVRAARGHLSELLDRLDKVEWTPAALEELVRGYAETAGLKLGQIAQPLRAALTGSTVSPGVFEVMAVLGRDEVLGRLADASKGPSS